jgi:hypothetical protein
MLVVVTGAFLNAREPSIFQPLSEVAVFFLGTAVAVVLSYPIDSLTRRWAKPRGSQRQAAAQEEIFKELIGSPPSRAVRPIEENSYPEDCAGMRPERLPGKLAFILCHFNPAGWQSSRENYLRTLQHLRSHTTDIFSAEVAFEGQEFVSTSSTLRMRASDKHLLWQKERLLNLLVERLPAEYDKVAWIDADVIFLNQSLVQDAMEAVQKYKVVQLFSHVLYATHEGRLRSVKGNVGWRGARLLEQSKDARQLRCNPGIGFVLRRSVFPLYDRMIVGGGDQANLEAWTGHRTPFMANGVPPVLSVHYERWGARAFEKVDGSIGYIPGHCVHLFHGIPEHRHYDRRWIALRRCKYDPERDIAVDPENGLLRFTESCSVSLRKAVERHFFARREDDDRDKASWV